MVNVTKNQPRCMSSVGVLPLTSLTDDELVMKQTGKISDLYNEQQPTLAYLVSEICCCDKKSK